MNTKLIFLVVISLLTAGTAYWLASAFSTKPVPVAPKPAPVAAQPQTKPDAPKKAPTQATKLSDEEIKKHSVIAKTLNDRGYGICVGKADALTAGLLKDTTYNVRFATQPTSDLLTISSEINRTNKVVSFLSASFVRNSDVNCSLSYEMTTLWPLKCSAVVGKFYKDYALKGVMQTKFQVLEMKPGDNIYTLGLGEKACLTIKKQVL